ncbi:hypothetical protein pipiens_007773 [Culex pipiens pipiens]|uniref:Uncharacterized protein n=1 Tax=Culex pipiens pipiens TaxID=38569 RepID=A0ABD1DJX1_CULPP
MLRLCCLAQHTAAIVAEKVTELATSPDCRTQRCPFFGGRKEAQLRKSRQSNLEANLKPGQVEGIHPELARHGTASSLGTEQHEDANPLTRTDEKLQRIEAIAKDDEFDYNQKLHYLDEESDPNQQNEMMAPQICNAGIGGRGLDAEAKERLKLRREENQRRKIKRDQEASGAGRSLQQLWPGAGQQNERRRLP